jgi:hypothetical protein
VPAAAAQTALCDWKVPYALSATNGLIETGADATGTAAAEATVELKHSATPANAPTTGLTSLTTMNASL